MTEAESHDLEYMHSAVKARKPQGLDGCGEGHGGDRRSGSLRTVAVEDVEGVDGHDGGERGVGRQAGAAVCGFRWREDGSSVVSNLCCGLGGPSANTIARCWVRGGRWSCRMFKLGREVWQLAGGLWRIPAGAGGATQMEGQTLFWMHLRLGIEEIQKQIVQ